MYKAWEPDPPHLVFHYLSLQDAEKSKESKSCLVPLEYCVEGSETRAIPTDDTAGGGIRIGLLNWQLLTARPLRIYNLYTRGFRLGTSIYSSTSLGLPCCSLVDSPTAQACECATDQMWSGSTNQGNRVPEDICILTPYGVAFINRLNRYCDDVVYCRMEHPILRMAAVRGSRPPP